MSKGEKLETHTSHYGTENWNQGPGSVDDRTRLDHYLAVLQVVVLASLVQFE